MRYGEPIEAIGDEFAADAAQFNAQIAESSEAMRTALLRALNAADGNAKGVTVADVSPKGVMLKADGAKTVTYFSIPAPAVDQQHFAADIDRVIAYLQVANDELMIKLAQERLDQNRASFEARHKAQLQKIDKQVAQMRADESASTLSKIFKWIGAAIAIAATVIAATVATVCTYGAGAGSYVIVAIVVSAVVGTGAGTVMALDAGGVFEDLKESKVKEYMQQGMKREEAEKAASKIVMGLSLGAAILNAVVQIAAAVITGGATADIAGMAVVQLINGIAGALQAVQGIGSGIADLNKANKEYELAVASADVKRADAKLKEIKEFVNQNMEEIQALAEAMENHFKAYRAIVASKASSLIRAAQMI